MVRAARVGHLDRAREDVDGLVEADDDLRGRCVETLAVPRVLAADRRVREPRCRGAERVEGGEQQRASHRCGTPANCERWPKIAAVSRSEKSCAAMSRNT